MKNTLAENMLRFGVKNLKESDVKKIEASILTEQAVTSLESAFTDPRITQTSDIAQKNQIIWTNLISYYSSGLLGKEAIGWLKNKQYGSANNFQWESQLLALDGITAPTFRFTVQDMFVGKNHIKINQGSGVDPDAATENCIFICKDKMAISGPSGNQGTMYPLEYDREQGPSIDLYKAKALPIGEHLRIIGNNVYYFKSLYGNTDARDLVFTPISDKRILSLL